MAASPAPTAGLFAMRSVRLGTPWVKPRGDSFTTGLTECIAKSKSHPAERTR